MSGTADDRVYVAVMTRGPDGRIKDWRLLPQQDDGKTRVLMTDGAAAGGVRWAEPAELGFEPATLLRDVPLADGRRRRLVDGQGRAITCNVAVS